MCTGAPTCTTPHLYMAFAPALEEISVCFVVLVLECICIKYYLNHLLYCVFRKHEFTEEMTNISEGRGTRE